VVPELTNSRLVGGAAVPAPGRSDGIDPTVPIDMAPSAPEADGRSRPLRTAAAVAAVAILGGLVALALVAGQRSPEVTAPALPGVSDGFPAGATAESPAALAVANGDGQGTGAMDPEAMTGDDDPMSDASTTTALPATTTTTRASIQLPDLTGQDVGEAGGRLADLGIQVLVVGRVAPGRPPSLVIEQVPAGGQTVTLPLTVTLYIPRSSTLPDLVGNPADTACVQVRALGLQCEQVRRFDPQVPAGTVLGTEPAAGAAITDGQTIRVTVSLGPVVDRVVPDVAGLDEVAARSGVTDAGFLTIEVVVEPSSTVPQGQVIGTDPAAGSSVAADATVTLRISSGAPATIEVPSVVGLDRETAEAALVGAGLVVEVVEVDVPAGDPGIGLVVGVDPAAGTQLDPGATVTIQVGREAPPEGEPPAGSDPPPSVPPDG
jgi:beta-lactam-binding protein with PASTA domain